MLWGGYIVDRARENTGASTAPQFVEGLRSGSPECFESFYENYFSRIHGFAQRWVPSAEEAEDLTQEVFLAVMRSIDSYQGRADFGSWVFGVARNVARQHLRNRGRS
jgi:RNA polymerase sigma-70 factor (ECF subfamily)